MQKKFDRTLETECLMDYANDVAAIYFRYMFNHNMNMDDEEHPFVKNMREAQHIWRHDALNCEKPRDFKRLDKRLDELKQYFYDTTGEEIPHFPCYDEAETKQEK